MGVSTRCRAAGWLGCYPPSVEGGAVAGGSAATRKRPYPFAPRDVGKAPWASDMAGALDTRLGQSRASDSSLREDAAALMATSKAPRSYKTYRSAFNQFKKFSAEIGINPYAATEGDIIDYIAWLGRNGTVSARSLQPYLTAINCVYEDTGLGDGPAKGPTVSAVRNGLRAAQRETISTARRGALPAASALRIAEFTFDLAANWGVLALAKPRLDDNDRKTLRTLRNGLGVTSGYMTGSRPSSIVFLDQTVGVSASDDHGVVVNRDFVKGTTDEPDDARGKISLTYPLTDFYRRYRSAMATYVALWERCFGGAAGSRQPYLFELDPADTSSSAMTAWLDDMLNIVGILPPAGVKYLPGSLRSGMASACNALGVNMSRIEYIGGWAPGSTALIQHYIDPTVQADAAAAVFFGHLLPALSHPAAAAGPAAPRGAPHGAAGGV